MAQKRFVIDCLYFHINPYVNVQFNSRATIAPLKSNMARAHKAQAHKGPAHMAQFRRFCRNLGKK